MMAADYNKPISTDNYLDILTQLRDNITAAQNMLNDLTGVTNIPTGALRYDQTAKKFQVYNGATFVDTVLSKEAGGTGITNWVKATTAEAEAGTANKYPDAAGVKSAIETLGFTGDDLTLLWSGSAATVDLDTLGGGYPGDGFYIIRLNVTSGGVYEGLLYVKDGVYSRASILGSSTAGNDIYHGTDNTIGFVSTNSYLGSIASIEKVG